MCCCAGSILQKNSAKRLRSAPAQRIALRHVGRCARKRRSRQESVGSRVVHASIFLCVGDGGSVSCFALDPGRPAMPHGVVGTIRQSAAGGSAAPMDQWTIFLSGVALGSVGALTVGGQAPPPRLAGPERRLGPILMRPACGPAESVHDSGARAAVRVPTRCRTAVSRSPARLASGAPPA